MQTVFYARDQGPQCLESEITWPPESAEAFVNQLRSSHLTWYWHSVREEGRVPLPGQVELPRYRPLTDLTDQNWKDLILDIEEEVDVTLPYVEFRNLMLFGLNAELATPFEPSLSNAMQRFFSDLAPLEIVFVRIQDSTAEYLFFRHEISPEVRGLLDSWQLDPNRAFKVKPYKKLGSLQLESLYTEMKNWYR